MDGHDRGAVEGVTRDLGGSNNFDTQRASEQSRGTEALGRGRAGELGSRVLTYNPERAQQGRSDSNVGRGRDGIESERVGRNEERRESNLEYARDLAERDGDFLGAETQVQTEERLAEDREDVENELGLNGVYVKNLMDRNRKKITAETMAAVDKMIANDSYQPRELDQKMFKARTSFLGKVFGRSFGSRN